MSISIRLSGGLGNQIHQLAAGVAIAGRLETELVVDKSTINLGSNSNRKFELGGFDFASIRVPIYFVGRVSKINVFASKISRRFLGRQIQRFKDTDFVDKGIPVDRQIAMIRDGSSISGHFTDFSWIRIAQTFGFELKVHENLISDSTKEFALQISNQDIAIHLRYGDYLSNPSLFPIVNDNYVNKAKILLKNYKNIFTYSDDIPSAKKYCPETLKTSNRILGPNELSALETFWLLSKYQKLITSNSTFSSLAAYFSVANNYQVVTPVPYLKQGWTDTLPSTWNRIDIIDS